MTDNAPAAVEKCCRAREVWAMVTVGVFAAALWALVEWRLRAP